MTANRIELIDQHPRLADVREEVVAGLLAQPRWLPPKLFYDERGSQLFEEITRLPEYYPTRTEISILEANAEEMTEGWDERVALIELGSGSSTKVRILLDRTDGPFTYMPIDISKEHLAEAAASIATDYPSVRVVAVCSDYTAGLDIPFWDSWQRRVLFFPGSTIGNFEPEDAREFLRKLAGRLAPDDAMILGVDLRKNPARLHAAYNDSQGITAEFNLNVLRRINRELGADFDLARFEHHAFFDPTKGRIEMHLRSTSSQIVTIGTREFSFAPDETIHTENSYKYGIEDLRRLVDGTGFRLAQTWMDEHRLFSVHRLDVLG